VRTWPDFAAEFTPDFRLKPMPLGIRFWPVRRQRFKVSTLSHADSASLRDNSAVDLPDATALDDDESSLSPLSAFKASRRATY
jgi:hypothetical protein